MGSIRLWTETGQIHEGLLQCGSCYEISGTVNSIASASDVITFGIIDWNLVYSGQPLTALANIQVTQTIEFTSTGAYSKTFDVECIPFIQDTQLKPNIIIWNDSEITLTIDSMTLAPACQTEICSECFQLQENPEKLLLIEFWHDSDAFGIKYAGIGNTPINYKQQILIPGELIYEDYPYPEEEKFKKGSGIKSPIKTDSEKSYLLTTGLLPEYQHDLLRIALVHENLYINSKRFFKLEGSYSPEPVEGSFARQVIVELQEIPQNKRADFC